MTVFLPSRAQFDLVHSRIDQMPEGDNEAWRRQYYQSQVLASASHWPDARISNMGGMHDTDLRMFQQTPAEYQEFGGSTGPLLSPQIGYLPDGSWQSDLDMGTPSTTGISTDTANAYRNMRTLSAHYLAPPTGHERLSSSGYSPASSHDDLSPRQTYVHVQDMRDARPVMTRSTTAPEQGQRAGVIDALGVPPSIKRAGSEDEEEEYIPSEDPKPRGRKRQRIPHTAVERRYRENLNAHLEKLRQTVPSLASKRAAGASKPGEGVSEGVRPSKCEILNGAIEHITMLGKENASLKSEVKALKARMEDVERWYGARGSGFAT